MYTALSTKTSGTLGGSALQSGMEIGLGSHRRDGNWVRKPCTQPSQHQYQRLWGALHLLWEGNWVWKPCTLPSQLFEWDFGGFCLAEWDGNWVWKPFTLPSQLFQWDFGGFCIAEWDGMWFGSHLQLFQHEHQESWSSIAARRDLAGVLLWDGIWLDTNNSYVSQQLA
ncbi:uncharacterized protein LY89DRAFT_731751 [Mollisia scopiformis]|uniref:Uncharacterized protein n=1 Tax=Mollisia scopiformis TaxID=149040 RepID=A0A194XGM5_MOLSC|nr:uncharacterized protein LY89DRAFT_731751 [Mollisia scopiformis]KUJ19350.1 hypothetical protein LY89DRAFT_731751 [Mollisia scopiformis]